ncbi:hypothetical protein ACVOMV_11620 [Mesorhizobium atlanticum]
MTEWKPEGPKVSGASAPYQKGDFGCKVPQMAFDRFKQALPHYCAVQHDIACFRAKFFVTFSPALV